MSDRRVPLSLKLVNRWLSRSAQPGSDDELLRLYAMRRDEAAFAQLVKRHGPMVLGVCRRLLGEHALAEDAFQATFLLLAQKAGTLRQPERLAGWLHGVAVKVASRARQRLRPSTQLIETAARQDADPERREALRLLDEELAGLAEVERLPLVLCYLEGLTHVEAARRLGWPSGSFSWRLARAQAALRDRLVRRGVFLAAPALSALLGTLAEATVPEMLEALAVRVASWVSLGHGPSLAVQLAAETTVPISGSGVGLAAKMALAAAVLLTSGLGWWWAAAGQGGPAPSAPGKAAVTAATPELPPGATARLGSLAFRNQGPLGTQFIGSRLTKDGQVLEGITASGAIQRWAFPTGKPLGIQQPFREPLTKDQGWHGVYMNDRSAVRDGQEILVGDLSSGRILFRCPVNSSTHRPFEYCLCRNGELLAVVAVHKERADENAPLLTHTTLDLYEVESGKRVHSQRSDEELYLLQVVDGGVNLLFGNRLFKEDNQLWHLDTRSFKRTELHPPEGSHQAFAFDADSPRVLFKSAAADGPDPNGERSFGTGKLDRLRTFRPIGMTLGDTFHIWSEVTKSTCKRAPVKVFFGIPKSPRRPFHSRWSRSLRKRNQRFPRLATWCFAFPRRDSSWWIGRRCVPVLKATWPRCISFFSRWTAKHWSLGRRLTYGPGP